jgi:hypothetical protein
MFRVTAKDPRRQSAKDLLKPVSIGAPSTRLCTMTL